jgi:Flp pilus assembly protein protease CpaA
MDTLVDLPPAFKLAVQVGLSAWMIAVAVSDHRTGRIPNALTAPVFLGVGAYRLFEGVTGQPVRLLMLVAWALIFVLWMAHFIGGGDAKFLMALYALFPSMEFTAILALILLLITVPLVLVEFWQRRGSGAAGSAWRRVVTGQLLPSEADLQERGRRYAWTFAVPGLVYTWFYW